MRRQGNDHVGKVRVVNVIAGGEVFHRRIDKGKDGLEVQIVESRLNLLKARKFEVALPGLIILLHRADNKRRVLLQKEFVLNLMNVLYINGIDIERGQQDQCDEHRVERGIFKSVLVIFQ